MNFNRATKALIAVLLALPTAVSAGPTLEGCWTRELPSQLVDVDGDGRIAGALSLPSMLLPSRLQNTSANLGVLVPGYDQLRAAEICQLLGVGEKSKGRLVFGGRERVMAAHKAPAESWLMVTAETVATNLAIGGLHGIFVGTEKAVGGNGMARTTEVDPAKLATELMSGQLAQFEPVVLFVGQAHQQRFFDFFANNPLPGVFISFDSPEKVRDVLNKRARLAADGRLDEAHYYCY